MPAPTLTPQEIAQLQKEAVKQQNFADSLTAQIPAKAARAAELAVADGGFKKFFDYYNDDIISKYDDEYRQLNGRFIVNPITEADIEGPANVDGSVRTTPTLPVTDIIRVPEFDGGGTSTDPVNETQHIADQALIEGYFVSGFSPIPTFNITTETSTVLTGVSTSLGITDPTNPITFSVGDIFVVKSISDSAVVKVTSATPGPTGPPYTYTLGIQVLVPPVGSLPIASTLDSFSGFTNGERNTKTASDPSEQSIMDGLVLQLQNVINARIARLDAQITALNANEDPDGTAQITTALTNTNTSKTFLTNYLVSTDVSDTGLGSLATERGVRSPQITTRVGQINANYTGQTEDYYERRYGIANDRGNTSRGTLRLQKATEASSATLVTYAASAQDAVDAINALLP